MLYYAKISKNKAITDIEISESVNDAIKKAAGGADLFIVPPDITRLHSNAGKITESIWEEFGPALSDIMPALGTHKAMTETEYHKMFGSVPTSLFREHKWRTDISTIGEVPGEYISFISKGKLNYSWPVQLNNALNKASNKLIVSIGQVVPHEVIGMANYNKNLLIGCGGAEAINLSHFLGAVCGMENIMGKASTPVRELLNFAEGAFLNHLNILYILTVISQDKLGNNIVSGLFIGDDPECYYKAASLSSELNITIINKPIKKALVYLDPEEYRSTWLGNKAIYRLRMAMADDGEIIILAPGVKSFGEDPVIDSLIKKYAYRPGNEVLELVEKNEDLQNNLAVAAHLIHGSPENRFQVRYCTKKISKKQILDIGYLWGDPDAFIEKYKPSLLKDGFNTFGDGEEIFFVSNPALGLWKREEENES